jgi:hypothetical protein
MDSTGNGGEPIIVNVNVPGNLGTERAEQAPAPTVQRDSGTNVPPLLVTVRRADYQAPEVRDLETLNREGTLNLTGGHCSCSCQSGYGSGTGGCCTCQSMQGSGTQ